MDFKKNIKLNIADTEIEIKPYLTSNEKRIIIAQALEREEYIDRLSVIRVLILRYCTDIKEIDKDEVSEELVDIYSSVGLFDELHTILANDIADIMDAIDYAESINTMFKALAKVAENIDVNAITEKIKEAK